MQVVLIYLINCKGKGAIRVYFVLIIHFSMKRYTSCIIKQGLKLLYWVIARGRELNNSLPGELFT